MAANARFKLNTEIPHCRSAFIGLLQGTWHEMGMQYGQRCPRDIARNWELLWTLDVVGEGLQPRLWQKGRGKEQRIAYVMAYLGRYLRELTALSPELVEFFRGIADGASQELDKCTEAARSPHLLKIAALNFVDLTLHPNWDFASDRPSQTSGQGGLGPIEGHDCNSMWIGAAATRTGETYAARAVQSGHWTPEGKEGLFNRQVAYVAIPKDPNARVFWGQGAAGNLGGLGGGLMNEDGLCCLTSGCSYSEQNWALADETTAPGIRDFVLAAYGVIFSRSAAEAAERITIGTESYRRATGRKTVMRARGANIVFADVNEALCVEQNAQHYAIRRPGDAGERNGAYIVTANHFKGTRGSFDRDNHYQEDYSMARFEPENPDGPTSSYDRFWSGMWMIRNNYGGIDRQMLMADFMASHYSYDESGHRSDPESDGTPAKSAGRKWSGTFCTHSGPFDAQHPLGRGGNANTSVFNLSTREVWWVPVWPCHYKEWNMDWECVDLKPFAAYRKGMSGCVAVQAAF